MSEVTWCRTFSTKPGAFSSSGFITNFSLVAVAHATLTREKEVLLCKAESDHCMVRSWSFDLYNFFCFVHLEEIVKQEIHRGGPRLGHI